MTRHTEHVLKRGRVAREQKAVDLVCHKWVWRKKPATFLHEMETRCTERKTEESSHLEQGVFHPDDAVSVSAIVILVPPRRVGPHAAVALRCKILRILECHRVDPAGCEHVLYFFCVGALPFTEWSVRRWFFVDRICWRVIINTKRAWKKVETSDGNVHPPALIPLLLPASPMVTRVGECKLAGASRGMSGVCDASACIILPQIPVFGTQVIYFERTCKRGVASSDGSREHEDKREARKGRGQEAPRSRPLPRASTKFLVAAPANARALTLLVAVGVVLDSYPLFFPKYLSDTKW